MIYIHSEIDSLKNVVVHCPGPEIARMTQPDLQDLLFDDLLSPQQTVREHLVMQEILGCEGAQVHQLTDLLVTALHEAPAEGRRRLLESVCALSPAKELCPFLEDWDPEKLARGLIAGLSWEDFQNAPMTLARIRARLFETDGLALSPVPNLMFMRDPCIPMYGRVLMGQMAKSARARESLLVNFALSYGPLELKSAFLRHESHHLQPHAIEGGDVLILSPHWILIGCSERTTPQTIQQITEHVLFPTFPDLHRVYAVMMPAERSLMHLDTLLTQIDHRLFLGYRPMIEGQHSHRALSIARLERDQEPVLLPQASVLDVLREEISPAVQLVSCGGQDYIYQQREQWTDGANAFCVSPGHIVLYGRNVHTIETLRDYGFQEFQVSPVQEQAHRQALLCEAQKHDRVVYSFTGSELSRARGGGRCLTMPIERRA